MTPIQPTSTTKVAVSDHALMVAAKKLETAFLAEMLKSAGLGKARTAFGGGTGEDQFSSFLVDAQAEQMVEAGGIGLAENLFNIMKDERDEQ